jgi:hypothetical protein
VAKLTLSTRSTAAAAALTIRDNAIALIDYVSAVELEAQRAIAANTETLNAHLNNPDLRPRIHFKSHSNGRWTVSLNDQIYTVGVVDPLPTDEDAFPFYWITPDNRTFGVSSKFEGLMEIFTHFCKPSQTAEPMKGT